MSLVRRVTSGLMSVGRPSRRAHSHISWLMRGKISDEKSRDCIYQSEERWL